MFSVCGSVDEETVAQLSLRHLYRALAGFPARATFHVLVVSRKNEMEADILVVLTEKAAAQLP